MSSVNTDLISKIDQWENTWFDVADAALKRSYPEIHSRLFLNLSKTEGFEVITSVSTLLGRINELRAVGEESTNNALALLAKRGLNEDRLHQAETLIEQARNWSEPATDTWAVDRQELEEARTSMWQWYVDWAQTARTVVKSKRMRITMGLSSQADRTPQDPSTPEAPETPEE